MGQVAAIWRWAQANKAPIGCALAVLYGALYLAGPEHVPPQILEALDKLAPLLIGAGWLKSDSYHRARRLSGPAEEPKA